MFAATFSTVFSTGVSPAARTWLSTHDVAGRPEISEGVTPSSTLPVLIMSEEYPRP